MKSLVQLILISITLPVAAKGLDDLKPTEGTAAEAEAAATQAAEGAAEKAGAAVLDAANPANAGQSAAPTEQAVVKPSAASLFLADRLHLGTSFGFVRITKAKKGEYAAQGMADLSLLWTFINGDIYDLAASLRYAPIQSDNEIEGQSYKSIIDGYHLGVSNKFNLMTNALDILASLELGYLLVYQDSIDRAAVREDDESNEIAVTIGTGLDWQLAQKIALGPRVYVGFGAFTIVQFTASATFSM